MVEETKALIVMRRGATGVEVTNDHGGLMCEIRITGIETFAPVLMNVFTILPIYMFVKI